MIESLLEWVIGVVVLAALAVVGLLFWLMWQDSQRPTFVLKKEDWACTRSENRTHLQPLVSGKVTTLIPVTNSVCVEYRRHAG
jgi:hypothetical protein